MSKVINVAYTASNAMEYALSSNVTNSDDFQRLKDEVQIIERKLDNPRRYRGGWSNRRAKRK